MLWVAAKRTFTSAPLPGFGSSTRQHQSKLFLTPAHEKINYGKASPGPLTYLPPITDMKRAPGDGGSTFGKCDRWYTRKIAARFADNPSPAAYNI